MRDVHAQQHIQALSIARVPFVQLDCQNGSNITQNGVIYFAEKCIDDQLNLV